MSEEDQARYKKYIQRAKLCVEEGDVQQAVAYNKKALKIYHTDKLARKIKKMEVCVFYQDQENGGLCILSLLGFVLNILYD